MKKQAKILIVDDAPTNIMILKACLKGSYAIESASSGHECLEIINSSTLPDLILLDIEMPDMNGYEVAEKLKSSPETASIAMVAADGTSNSTITVQAKNSLGNNVTTGGDTVALTQTGSATISTVTDNGNGTYTATISSTIAETVTVSGTVAGSSIGNTANIMSIGSINSTLSINLP